MKEQERIPTGKVQRATKFIKTGAQIGGNYVKHYTKKMFDQNFDRDEIHRDNAEDIYNSLSHLKGSALKVAQMMSLDKNLLPRAYQQKFMMAQYSAPPLSYPLVVKTFKKYLGKGPEEIFDSFTHNAVNAASIGQVHQATLRGKKLAVKIQYPGVADSISSDLKIVKPFAKKLFNISDADLNHYLGEVESKLLEETDYSLELKRSMEISKACRHLSHIHFPHYYPDLSGPRILTMDWLEGEHLSDFLTRKPSRHARDQIGQSLWDFYDFQIHSLKQVHADPHPGNFLFHMDGTVGIIDFGCVKEIPEDFYQQYFRIHDPATSADEKKLEAWLYDLEFLSEKDSPAEKMLFSGIFSKMVHLLGRPFFEGSFDFSDESFFDQIYSLGEQISKMKEVRNSRTARGSKHGLYINRAYFGLYHLLNSLQAKILTRSKYFSLKIA